MQLDDGNWYICVPGKDGKPIWVPYDIVNDPAKIRDHEDHENQAFDTFGSSSSFQPGSPDTDPRYQFHQSDPAAGGHDPVSAFPRENPPNEELYEEPPATELDQPIPVEDDELGYPPVFPPLALASEEDVHPEAEEGEQYEADDNVPEDQGGEDEGEDSEEDDEPAPLKHKSSHSSKYSGGRAHKDTTSTSKDSGSRSSRKPSKPDSEHKSSKSKGKEPAKSHRHSDRKDKDSKREKKESRGSRDNDEQESRRSRRDYKESNKSRPAKGKGRADDHDNGDGYDQPAFGGDPRQFAHGSGFGPLQPLPIRPGPGVFSPSMPPVLEDHVPGPLGIPGRAEIDNQYPEDPIGSWPDQAELLELEEDDEDPEVEAAIRQSRDEYYQAEREDGPSSGHPYEQVDRSGSQTPRPFRNYGGQVEKKDHLKGTKGDAEPLDHRYKICHSYEFAPGSVFKVLWFEPKGKPIGGGSKVSELVRMRDAKKDFYVGFRRFIVIANDEGHCTCVPILTYGRQGCNKPGVKAKQHGMIYLNQAQLYPQHQAKQYPPQLPNEPELGFPPVRIVIDARNETISEESRVNYSKLINVEHNVKVFFIGRIFEEDSDIVFDAVDKCWDRKFKKQRRDR